MKRSNLEVGLRVILKKDTLSLGLSEFIGQEFNISQVEQGEYTGELTVMIEGPTHGWCSHRDIKRVKVKPAPSPRPFKVGDTVRVIAPDGRFPVGTVGTVTHDDGEADPIPFRVEEDRSVWYYHERDLELYVEGSAPAQPEDKAPEIGALFVVTGYGTAPDHCFAMGTVVRCVEPSLHNGGNCRYANNDDTRQYVSLSDLKPLSLAGIQEALDK